MKRADAFLIFALLAVGAALVLLRGGEKADTARVYLNGELVWECSLADTGKFSVSGVTVKVEGGAARVTESDCPDKSCVNSGAINGAGESIVCLPNRVSVALSGNGEMDAVLR